MTYLLFLIDTYEVRWNISQSSNGRLGNRGLMNLTSVLISLVVNFLVWFVGVMLCLRVEDANDELLLVILVVVDQTRGGRHRGLRSLFYTIVVSILTVLKYKFWRERGLGAVLIGLPFPAHRCLLSWTANYSLPWLELNCPNRWLRQASLKLKNKCQRQLLCLKQSLCFLLILQGITVITKMNLYSP